VKRPLLALILSITLLAPAHGARAADFVEPMVKAWQMMDAMRQMMEWFVGGSNRNNHGNQWMPFGSLNTMPYGNNLNSLNLLGLNRNLASPYAGGDRYLNRGYPQGSGSAAMARREGEWLREPLPYEDSFWGDDPYWDSHAVPLGESYPASRSGYEGIDGVWFANSGERWMIQGNQFILRRTNGTLAKGEFTIKDDWIVVRHYDGNVTISLQFRQMDDLLVIRDRSGTAALLHRLPESRTPINYGGYVQ
jgi:hypothetical protein